MAAESQGADPGTESVGVVGLGSLGLGLDRRCRRACAARLLYTLSSGRGPSCWHLGWRLRRGCEDVTHRPEMALRLERGRGALLVESLVE